jgi:general secretion pathway protein H
VSRARRGHLAQALAADNAPCATTAAPRPRPARASRGFTLLELLVVIVLAGLLLSIVTISVTPDERQSLAREGQRIGHLFALAADEARIRAEPIVWEADLRGYRFVTEVGGERQLITQDDLLRERPWERPLTRLAIYPGTATAPSEVLLDPAAPAVRVPIAREWVQTRWRLELTSDVASVAVDFDEAGKGHVATR